MNQYDKKFGQFMNQRILAGHIDRALQTINKFRNSYLEETRLRIYKTDLGDEFVFLKDLLNVQIGLENCANRIAAELGINADGASWGNK